MAQAELAILDWIQTLRGPFLDWLVPLVTILGDAGILWILLTLVLLCSKKHRRTGLVLALSLLLDLLVCNVLLKPLVGRIRPFDLNPLAPELLVAPPGDFSFPSGHTAASFTAVAALFAQKSPLRIPALVIAVLISLSRLYLYVHFPTDVLAGALLGLALGWTGQRLFLLLERRWKAKKV